MAYKVKRFCLLMCVRPQIKDKKKNCLDLGDGNCYEYMGAMRGKTINFITESRHISTIAFAMNEKWGCEQRPSTAVAMLS